jgi:hypothetical protein
MALKISFLEKPSPARTLSAGRPTAAAWVT